MRFKKALLLFTVSLVFISASIAQNSAVKALKFDFGSGKTQKGFISISSSSKYTQAKGYGFIGDAVLKGINHGGKNALQTDFITSDKPFYFTVDLPEGNYDITVHFGDEKGTSAQTVRAECRRLMLENTRTLEGKVVSKNFTVHIRTPEIGKTGERVQLKPREVSYFHWDKQLTLEFNGEAPKICGVEIKPAKNPIQVFLAGNSTVVDQDKEPYAAWGQMIPAFFEPGSVVVANYAESGEAISSFKSAKRLDKVLSQMKKGDYLFIEFGHNDQKQKGEGIGPFTSYKKDLKFYISEVKKRGGIPVLVTSMHRRNFDSTGVIINTLGDYPAAVRETAKEEGVAFIDLNEMSKILYEAWGPKKTEKAFVIYPANTFPNQDKELKDNTHFNPYGAYEIAKCIIKGIRDNRLGIAQYIKKDLHEFNPAKPDKVEDFYWPLSPGISVVKPDGN